MLYDSAASVMKDCDMPLEWLTTAVLGSAEVSIFGSGVCRLFSVVLMLNSAISRRFVFIARLNSLTSSLVQQL